VNVLIVDDDPLLRKALIRIVASRGHSVVEAGNALEAVEILDTQSIHVALIDYELKTSMTGIDVGKHAIRRGATPVIVSGYPIEVMRPVIEDPLRGFAAVIPKDRIDIELLPILDRVEDSLEDTQP
jgi:CheY-like chemotaxis protein